MTRSNPESVFVAICEHPGITTRQLTKRLNVPVWEIQRSLIVLLAENEIIGRRAQTTHETARHYCWEARHYCWEAKETQ